MLKTVENVWQSARFGFLQRLWGLWSSGMLRRTEDNLTYSDVSEVCRYSSNTYQVFKMNALTLSETSVHAKLPGTSCNISDTCIPKSSSTQYLRNELDQFLCATMEAYRRSGGISPHFLKL